MGGWYVRDRVDGWLCAWVVGGGWWVVGGVGGR